MARTTCLIAVILSAATVSAAGLGYVAPPGWTPLATSSPMRVAQFVLPGRAGSVAAELVVYYFGGSGGSVDANIERWIGQVQQPDGRSSSAVARRETRTVNGLAVTLVDVSGTYVAEVSPGSASRHDNADYRLRAAVVETPAGPYFIKLIGPATTVGAESEAFERFVASLQYTP